MADLIELLYLLYLSVLVEKIIETVIIVAAVVFLTSITGYVMYDQNEKYFKETGKKITWAIWIYSLSIFMYVMIVLIILAEIWG